MLKSKADILKIWELAMLLALSITLCAGVWAQGRQSSISRNLVRLHVIAISDEPQEQALKLQVRDAVLDYLSPKLKDAQGSGQAKAIIEGELDGIKAAAESVSQGRAVTVVLGRESYPTKRYEGFTLPAGQYDSLRVILGEGQGHNWWCIVFPPICLSAAQSQPVEEQLSEADYRLISEEEGYDLRFRAVELWGELINKLQ